METYMILVYGSSGSGKTVDAGYSFPNAVFVGHESGLLSIKHQCGYNPRHVEVLGIPALTQMLKNAPTPEKPQFLVIDDMSFLAQQTVAQVQATGISGRKLWGKVNDLALDFRATARKSGWHIIMNAWIRDPSVDEETRTRKMGGPQLPGSMMEGLSALCDSVYRCGVDMQRKPFPGVYLGAKNNDYIQKCRFSVVNAIQPAPMNLGEIMRVRGVDVPRNPEIHNQEQLVEMISGQLEEVEPARLTESANTWYTSLVDAGQVPAAARWTLRDAYDRMVIRRALKRADTQFI